jgi:hypothetical protein
MLDDYVRVLAQIAKDPEIAVSDVELGAQSVKSVGRRHDELRFRGFCLGPRLHELVTCLRVHPAVSDAASRWDPAENSIVAYIVLAHATPPSRSDLNQWLKRNMTKYVLPGRYVAVGDLPLGADGTPDRLELARLRGEPLDDGESSTASRSHIEATLTSIWRKLLGRRRVGLEENFFALGGDLILGIEMVARARAAGIPINAPDVVRGPTIAELAEQATALVDPSGALRGGEDRALSPVPARRSPSRGLRARLLRTRRSPRSS